MEKVNGMKTYKVNYADENFEIVYAEDDREAFTEAEKYEKEHGSIFDIFEIDEKYNEIRTVF